MSDDAQQKDRGRQGGRVGTVPDGVRTAAAWSWRLLLIGAAVYVLLRLATLLGPLVLSLFGGLLLTALLRPAADRISRGRVPRLAATWLLILATLAAVVGLAWLVELRVAAELQMLRQSLATGIERLRDLLVGTLGLPRERLDELSRTLVGDVLGAAPGGAGLGLVQGATVLFTTLGLVALSVFTAFWLVYDGERVGRWVIRLLPGRAERAATAAAGQAWRTLGGFLRGITLVALIDAVGIGVALVLIGVPLPLTLALLTFLGGFVPLIGAPVAGAVAVLVALAAKGTTAALLTLAAVVVVQQVEGQLLYPIVMGRALTLHPVAIAYALTAGALLYGVGGAVLAVPLAAVLHAVASSLANR